MPKKAILCVNDEKTVLVSLKAQIKKNLGNSYTYEFAESAEEAWEVIEEFEEEGIEILKIVTDWLMPQMKGDGFLIQVHHKYPNIAKIRLTGQADEEAVKKAQHEANLLCCLRKPWTESDLINTIHSGLDKI